MDKLLTPEFILQAIEKLTAFPVLFFVLIVMIIFYLVIRMQHKTIDKKLNGDK